MRKKGRRYVGLALVYCCTGGGGGAIVCCIAGPGLMKYATAMIIAPTIPTYTPKPVYCMALSVLRKTRVPIHASKPSAPAARAILRLAIATKPNMTAIGYNITVSKIAYAVGGSVIDPRWILRFVPVRGRGRTEWLNMKMKYPIHPV